MSADNNNNGDGDDCGSNFDIASLYQSYKKKNIAGETNELHIACYDGNIDKIKSILEKYESKPSNINTKNKIDSSKLSNNHFSFNEKLKLLNARDIRGNTVLHIACHFGDDSIVKYLLKEGANIGSISDGGWHSLHEAAASGQRELCNFLFVNDVRNKKKLYDERVNEACAALLKVKDFYLEIKWEFSTWVPFVSSFLPSDTYRIWKIGNAIRIDTTIVGFKGTSFVTGDNSLIFTGSKFKHKYPKSCAILNRKEKTISWIRDNLNENDQDAKKARVNMLINGSRSLSCRKLTGSIKFSQATSLFWGEPIVETVNDQYQGKVYNFTNFQVTVKKRREYSVRKSGKDRPLKNRASKNFDTKLSKQEYFFNSDSSPSSSSSNNVPRFDNGNGLLWDSESLICEKKEFDGNITLSDQFPLTVKEILPLIKVMTPMSDQFENLREFIELDFPRDGFPVKLKLPGLFVVVSAEIQFQNFKSLEKHPNKESLFKEKFTIPSDFHNSDSLLHDAIESSLSYQKEHKNVLENP